MSTVNDRAVRAALVAQGVIRPTQPGRIKLSPAAIKTRRADAVTAGEAAMRVLREAALRGVLRTSARTHIGRLAAR